MLGSFSIHLPLSHRTSVTSGQDKTFYSSSNQTSPWNLYHIISEQTIIIRREQHQPISFMVMHGKNNKEKNDYADAIHMLGFT